jgi:hypothetical protein
LTEHIRWVDDAKAGESAGFVGSFIQPTFRIWPPDAEGDCLLFAYLAGHQGDLYHGDSPEGLKAKAERLLAELVSSLGAVYPDSYEFAGDDVPLEDAFGNGAYVRYQHPDAGWPGEQDEARKLLTHGRLYRVAWNDIGDSKTRIGLVGVTGTFNSVLFEPVAGSEVTDAEAAEIARRLDEPAEETGQ